ncbi:MAG: 4'-phosphopantetheinyl transferase superfamily protein [Gemmatimonadota bacterium]
MSASGDDARVSVWCVPVLRRFSPDDAPAASAVPFARPGETAEAALDRMRCLLSAEERAVAEGFESADRRRAYIAAHALLRVVLGHYAGVAPNELVFRYGRRGKPELASPERDLQFNMSHSRDMVLVAVARGRRVGVDIEHIDEPGDVRRIAARFLSPRDRDAIDQLPADRQRDAFLRCWTRKEAYMKARGDGISRPLDDFDVTVSDDAARARLRTAGNPNESDAWELADVAAPRGFMAAIAVEGHGCEVVQHDDWPHLN